MQRGKDTPGVLLNSLPKYSLFSLLSQYFSSATWQFNHITPFYSSPWQGGRTIVAELWCVKSWHIVFNFPELLEIVKHSYCSYCFILVSICIFLSAWQADTAVSTSPVGWARLKLFLFPHGITVGRKMPQSANKVGILSFWHHRNKEKKDFQALPKSLHVNKLTFYY